MVIGPDAQVKRQAASQGKGLRIRGGGMIEADWRQGAHSLAAQNRGLWLPVRCRERSAGRALFLRDERKREGG